MYVPSPHVHTCQHRSAETKVSHAQTEDIQPLTALTRVRRQAIMESK